MMIVKISAMIYILIMVYLFIANGDKTVQVINSIGGNVTKLSKTLQGR